MILPDGLVLGCVPRREICVDCLLSSRYGTLDELPRGARVGTSSLRRQAQLLNLRPDLEILSLRGNVDTRLRKMKEGEYDAIVLASAGLQRLGLSADRMQHFEAAVFVPAVGQGALGIECRGDDSDVLELLSRMEHRPTRVCVEAERGFLAGLDGGCQVPIAGHAEMLDDDRFIGTSFFRTPLLGLDFSTCQLEGVALSDTMAEIYGTKMNVYQAAALARRLGVIVAE